MNSTNEHGQRVGAPVPGWSPRPVPERVVLPGDVVRLEPVTTRHVPDLYAALCSPADEALWTYRADERPGDEAALTTLVERWEARRPDVTFAIVPTSGDQHLEGQHLEGQHLEDRPEGVATLMRVDADHGVIEVGSVLFSRALQRTRAATEAIHLLAAYVFDELGYCRLEWKLDALNQPSARAARRLGFRREGVFRQAMVYKGRSRDTEWFALTDADWPAVRAAHRRWLDPANFNTDGHQRTSLSDLTH